jgi:hypothetical protein
VNALRERVRRLREVAADDRGTSLVELVVGMVVMTVFMTVFTGAIASLAETTTHIEAVTSSASQVNNAFLRLDKLVRYATAVTTPGQGTSGDWYVELDSVIDAKESCTQLRVDVTRRQLQQRTWTVNASGAPYSDYVDWRPLASNVLNASAAPGSDDQPFSFPAASSTSLQRLTVTLVTGTSGAASCSTTRSSLGFTALNSSVSDTTNATQCRQLGSTVYRP